MTASPSASVRGAPTRRASATWGRRYPPPSHRSTPSPSVRWESPIREVPVSTLEGHGSAAIPSGIAAGGIGCARVWLRGGGHLGHRPVERRRRRTVRRRCARRRSPPSRRRSVEPTTAIEPTTRRPGTDRSGRGRARRGVDGRRDRPAEPVTTPGPTVRAERRADRGDGRRPAGPRRGRRRGHAAVAATPDRSRVLGGGDRRHLRAHDPPGRDGIPEVLGDRRPPARSTTSPPPSSRRPPSGPAPARPPAPWWRSTSGVRCCSSSSTGRRRGCSTPRPATTSPTRSRIRTIPANSSAAWRSRPEGRFKVDRERPEGWWEGDLGKIYRPKYFKGGIAVHGSGNVPNYAASHGCVRVSVPAMDFIWDQNLMPMRTAVWVHS